jgi:hypothetical protein
MADFLDDRVYLENGLPKGALPLAGTNNFYYDDSENGQREIYSPSQVRKSEYTCSGVEPLPSE